MSTATTLEIPKETWKTFFNDIGREYGGWAVTVELLHHVLGDQADINGLPLQGLSYDPVGSQAGDILIEAGDAGMPFATHLIHRPVSVRMARTEPGAEADIEIESEQDFTSLVRIRRRPELTAAPKKRR